MSLLVKKYRAVVIGGGRIGIQDEFLSRATKPRTHSGAFLKHPRILFAGIAETDSEQRKWIKRHFPDIAIFKTGEELLRKTRPDIVSIATPDKNHFVSVKQAVRFGARLIICEKPISISIQEAKNIITLAKKNHALLLVNHMRRFDPILQRVKQDIQNKKFGRIQAVRALYVNGLFNNGTHVIDLLRWYLGEVMWVEGWENKKAFASHPGDRNIDGVLQFSNGVRAMLQALDRDEYYIFEHEFYGTKGAVMLYDLSFSVGYIFKSRQPHTTAFHEFDRIHMKQIGRQNRSFFEAMADHAVACLDGRVHPLSSGEDALKTLKVLTAFEKSAETPGRKIWL